MTVTGRVQNGVVVFDQPLQVPDGTVARVDLLPPLIQVESATPQLRRGGQWKGRVVIAPDFDELPNDMEIAFGILPVIIA